MDAADAESTHRSHGVDEKRHEKGGGMDSRWTTSGAASGGQEEGERQRDDDGRFHGRQQQLYQHSLQMRQAMAPPSQKEHASQGVLSRRSGRPFRKRGKLALFRESYHANASGRATSLRLASTGFREAVAVTERPSNVSIDCAGAQLQHEEHVTTVVGARTLANAASAAAAIADDDHDFDPGDFSFSTTSVSQCHVLQASLLYQPCHPASSITRVLSSETYLRRLFVTASLAHVLSLDAFLPRSMPMKRNVSSRVAGKEGGWGEEGDGEGEGAWCGGEHGNGLAGGGKGRKGHCEAGRSNTRGIHNNSGGENIKVAADAIAAATHDSSGSFKIVLPATLIDPGGQPWTMTYVTTTQQNLHSGRLVDGWETFCSANRLRIGDEVDFTRVEAHEREGGRLGKEAVARVVVRKKHCRNK